MLDIDVGHVWETDKYSLARKLCGLEKMPQEQLNGRAVEEEKKTRDNLPEIISQVCNYSDADSII